LIGQGIVKQVGVSILHKGHWQLWYHNAADNLVCSCQCSLPFIQEHWTT